ncbi:MAG: BLUF domain-containing protein [Gammaproteobacteria bacterium]
MSDLIHIVYSSVETVEFTDADLADLLDVARKNNRRMDLSGMLLYDQGNFFQVLEGRPDRVEQLFEHIGRDPRHERVVTIIREPIEERSFFGWSMGHAKVSTESLGSIDGMNDFFSYGRSFKDITPGRALKLLEAFRDGKWRRSLSDSN